MRRGNNKVTLYELMHQASESNDAKVPGRSDPAARAARVVRLPIGFLYAGLVVVLLLLIAFYAYGYHRGHSEMAAQWAQDTIDSAEAEQPVTVASTEPPAEPRVDVPTTAPQAAGDPRQPGLNYYVICHPSRAKVDELVAFCGEHGLVVHSIPNRKGDPKVYVTPGFASGESSGERMVALRGRIREVGVLWNRRDPGQNSDFSTHYPETYQP
jgi:hypothetical protein